MKSVFLSILIFIVVFSLLKMNVLMLVDNHFFVPIALGAFIIVLGCAIYFVGLPKTGDMVDKLKQISHPEEKEDDEK